ncbi:hypothetical protein ACVWXM_006290 [Bradyrhizobium sp. GM7.3]
MSDQPVTAYAAARVLRRDRQTVVRVTDRLHPDALDRHGRPLWYVERIAEALALNPRERRESGHAQDRFVIHDKALRGLRVELDRQLTAIEAETSPDKRRAMAVALAPLLQEYQSTYLDVGRQLRVADNDTLGVRADLIVEEMIGELAEAAGCEADGEFFTELVSAMPAETD